MLKNKFLFVICAFSLMACFVLPGVSQTPAVTSDVRVMTIPISIFTEEELKKDKLDEYVQAGRLSVFENREEQEILSVRSVSNQPLALSVLIQDDLDSNVNLQLDDIREFIRRLPDGSRVMVAYIRGGTIQIRQSFTRNLDLAADAIRIVVGSPSVAPRSPYDSLTSALNRFDGLPNGRRAVLMVSDGLDVSNGISSASPAMSSDLDRSVLEAQRRGVAVYAIYNSASFTTGGDSRLVSFGQGSLNKLAEETGGNAFFQGFSNPISFKPFFRSLDRALTRQFALTYLSTHMKNGYYKVVVESSNPEVRIDHPKGYYYRKKKAR